MFTSIKSSITYDVVINICNTRKFALFTAPGFGGSGVRENSEETSSFICMYICREKGYNSKNSYHLLKHWHVCIPHAWPVAFTIIPSLLAFNKKRNLDKHPELITKIVSLQKPSLFNYTYSFCNYKSK